MAKFLKFFFEYQSLLEETHRVEIWEEGTPTATIELQAGAEPFVTENNNDVAEKYLGGIVPTVATVMMSATETFNSAYFSKQKYGDYILKFRVNGAIRSNAIITPFEANDMDRNGGYPITISAECGLRNLKNKKYVTTGTRIKLISVLKNCLAQIGFIDNFPIKVIDNTKCYGTVSFEQLLDPTPSKYWESYCDDIDFEGLNCYEVIDRIRKPYNQVFFDHVNGCWFVRNVDEISSQNSTIRTYSWADLSFTDLSYNRPTKAYIDRQNGSFGRMFSHQSVVVKKAKSKLKIRNTWGSFDNLTGWTYSGAAGLFYVINNGRLYNSKSSFSTQEAVGVDQSYIQSPQFLYTPFSGLEEKEKLTIEADVEMGSVLTNLRMQIITGFNGPGGIANFLSTDGNWYTVENDQVPSYEQGQFFGTPIYEAKPSGGKLKIEIPTPPYHANNEWVNQLNNIGHIGYWNNPFMGQIPLFPEFVEYYLIIRIFFPERGISESATNTSTDAAFGLYIDNLSIRASNQDPDITEGFERKFTLNDTQDRETDLTVDVGIGYPSYLGTDALYKTPDDISRIQSYSKANVFLGSEIDKFISDSYLAVLGKRLQTYQGTIWESLGFGDLVGIMGVKYRLHNAKYNARMHNTEVKAVELATNSTSTIDEETLQPNEDEKLIEEKIDRAVNRIDIPEFSSVNFAKKVLPSGKSVIMMNPDMRMDSAFADKFYAKSVTGGIITTEAEDTDEDFLHIKPAANGTYALEEWVTANTWMQGGNTVTAEKSFGTIAGNFDIPILRNNVEVGRWRTGGLTVPSLNISGLNASQLTATDASKNIVSLDTATYPSLAELAFVKGVTSPIQTQLNAKANGSGTTNFVTKWSNATGGLVNSQIFDNGTSVGIGTTVATNAKLSIRELVNVSQLSMLVNGLNIFSFRVTNENTSSLAIGNDFGGAFATRNLTLAQNGNVGIGTATPDSKVEISGSGEQILKITNTNNAVETVLRSLSSVNDGWVGTLTNHGFRIASNNNTAIYVDPLQNVGIGTATPARKLHIATGAVNDAAIQFTTNATGNTVNDGLYIGYSTRAAIWNYENTNMAFATNNIERMRISESGSVGIGTTSLTGISLRNSKIVTGATSAYGYLQDGQIQSDVTTFASLIQSNVSQVSGVTTPNVYAFIANQGTVSGTISNLNGYFVNSNLVGGVNNYGFRGIIPVGTNRWNNFHDGTAQNHFRGNVGIGAGSTVPTTELDVLGITRTTNLMITNGAAVGKVWQCNNANGAGEWVTPLSSERYIGEWAANSGVAPSASPTTGDYYVVNTAGTYLGITYAAGDEIYWNGTSWLKRSNFLTLPIATASVLGGIKIGTGLSIDGSGVVSVASSPILTTARTISATGDGTWSVSFNGSADVSGALTLATIADSGVGSAFVKITRNTKGLVTGTQAVVQADITGLLGAASITNAMLNDSGVAAGTYRSVTVNAKGIVTGGTNPTTVSGYGITDFYAQIVSGFEAGANATVLNTDSLEVALEKLQGQINARISGNQTISITGDATGSGTTSIALTLANVATAGTYRSVTVNAKGLVTAGTNPTTLAGYGITDVYTKTESDNTFHKTADTTAEMFEVPYVFIQSATQKTLVASGIKVIHEQFINPPTLFSNKALLVQGRIDITYDSNESVYLGKEAGKLDVTESTKNTIVGHYGLDASVNTSNNSGLGYQVLTNLTNGSGNVAIGYQAGVSYPTGNKPVVLTTSTDSIFIGREAQHLTNNSINQIVIGAALIGKGNNTVAIGNSSITYNYFNGSLDYTGLLSISGATGTSGQFLKRGASNNAWASLAHADISNLATFTGFDARYFTKTESDARFVALAGSYANPTWITSLAWSKLSGVPTTFAPSAHTHAAADIISGVIATARLGSGTASATTFLRGDQTWAIIPVASIPHQRIGFGDSSGVLSSSANFAFEDDRIISIKNGGSSKMELARFISSNNYGIYVTNGNLDLQSLTGGTIFSKSNHNFEGRILLNNTAGTAGQVLTSQGAGANPTWTTVAAGASQNLDAVLGVGNTAVNRNLILNATNGSFDAAALRFQKNGTTLASIFYDNQYLDRLIIESSQKIQINANTNPVELYGSSTIIGSLIGSGPRMVVANADGVLSTQAIPSGGGGGTSLAATQIAFGSGSNTVTSSANFVYSNDTVTITNNSFSSVNIIQINGIDGYDRNIFFSEVGGTDNGGFVGYRAGVNGSPDPTMLVMQTVNGNNITGGIAIHRQNGHVYIGQNPNSRAWDSTELSTNKLFVDGALRTETLKIGNRTVGTTFLFGYEVLYLI